MIGVQISNILDPRMVIGEFDAQNKQDLLHEIAQRLCARPAPNADNDDSDLNGSSLGRAIGEIGRNADIFRDTIFQALSKREQLGSTGVGDGIAIPHAKIPGLDYLIALFGRSPVGVEYDAIDAVPVNLVFALLVPPNSTGAHLKALARISRLLKGAEFRAELLKPEKDPAALYEAIVRAEAAVFGGSA